jgi:hypothetical protein
MLQARYNTFKHAGDRGDLIYALPAIKYLKGGRLYLWINSPYRKNLEDGTISLFTADKIKPLIPLLESQNYIFKTDIWRGEKIKYDFDCFRDRHIPNNLSEAQLEFIGVPGCVKDTKWLNVCPNSIAKIVIARSPRYHNNNLNWKLIHDSLKDDSIFIGSKKEHESFVNEIGDIPYYKTKDLLEAAEVIAGCKVFFGNQSCPYAIAEGLKANTIQETCPYVSNCIFYRPNSLNLINYNNDISEFLKRFL